MSTVHLTHCDLLLSRWHGAHAERLRANRAGSDHPWQRYGAVLHPAHAVKLLLKDGGPAGAKNRETVNIASKKCKWSMSKGIITMAVSELPSYSVYMFLKLHRFIGVSESECILSTQRNKKEQLLSVFLVDKMFIIL